MEYNNIFLIGMMFSGKSTMGQLLSKKLEMKLCDTDSDLEEILDMNISKIFKDIGEKKFRKLESTYFNEHTLKGNIIYSLGGGIILDINNHQILKERGKTIFLDCAIDDLYKRALKTNDFKARPLIDKNDIRGSMIKLYQKRYSLYTQCADIIVKSKSNNTTQLLNQIIAKLDE